MMRAVRPVFAEVADDHDDQGNGSDAQPGGLGRRVIGTTELRQKPVGNRCRKEHRAKHAQYGEKARCEEQLDIQQVGAVPVHLFRQQPRGERARTAPVFPDAKGDQNRAGQVENGVPHIEIEGRIKRRCDKVLQCFHVPNSVLGRDRHRGAIGPY